MRAISDRDLVKLCLEELYEKMGYVETAKIAQSDLEHLCYLIEEKTRIIISLSTLKRVFHEKFERLPQASTLDALTMFIGYGGWQDFKTKKTLEYGEIKIEPSAVLKPSVPPKRLIHTYRYELIIVLCILFGFLVISLIPLKNKKNSVTFSVKKIVAEGVPSNVIFNYNIDNVAGDSFYIQPSWNKNIRIKIKKNNYTQTDTYYEPGYHTAKLICDNTILKEVLVHIPTRDWIGYSKVTFFDPYPEYFKSEYIIRDSVLGITLDGLKASNVAIEKDKIYYYAYFPDSIRVNSNNFTLNARVKMSKIKNTLCPWIISEVYGQNSFFYFTGTIPGCTSEIQAMFSNKYIDGKTNDLSSFGYDVMSWKEIQMRVRDRVVKISIEGEEVFETSYERPGGLVRGMGFGSNGLCEVDYVLLRDSAGSIIYRNDF